MKPGGAAGGGSRRAGARTVVRDVEGCCGETGKVPGHDENRGDSAESWRAVLR
jgi:hypothetical protein